VPDERLVGFDILKTTSSPAMWSIGMLNSSRARRKP
jgi:hypothetical protein